MIKNTGRRSGDGNDSWEKPFGHTFSQVADMKIEDLQTVVKGTVHSKCLFKASNRKTIPPNGTSWNMMFSIAGQARGGPVGPTGKKGKNKTLFGSVVLFCLKNTNTWLWISHVMIKNNCSNHVSTTSFHPYWLVVFGSNKHAAMIKTTRIGSRNKTKLCFVKRGLSAT